MIGKGGRKYKREVKNYARGGDGENE